MYRCSQKPSYTATSAIIIRIQENSGVRRDISQLALFHAVIVSLYAEGLFDLSGWIANKPEEEIALDGDKEGYARISHKES